MNYIFWDFNGTILDDARLCYDILSEMLIEEKRPSVTFDEYLMIFDFPVESYYRKVYDLEKTSFTELAHRFIDKYQPRSFDLTLHEGFLETINDLTNKGYTHILLSASEEKNLHEQLKHFKIDHLFKYILGTSNIYAKSKVDVALDFIKKQGLDVSHAVMIGDTLHDAEVAHSLGLKIILYTKGHQHPKRLEAFTTIDDLRKLKNIEKMAIK